MSLRTYHAKRRFTKTTEPRGQVGKKDGRRYVIQKHDASHLHYDFRLELHGVLLSWAVPKGPSLDPREKRLAVHVEDHPLDYADFEGTIPEGQYGGGTVMVWDRGRWEPEGDPDEDYRRGRLSFRLEGEKLRGAWTLVRMAGRRSGDKENWLLIKSRDDYAQPLRRGDVLKKQPLSVKTGRDLAEIAAGKSARKTVRRRRARRSQPAIKSARRRAVARVHGKAHRLPKNLEAELATLVPAPPESADWLHEIKFDGYRMFAVVDHGRVRFRSRNGHDWTKQLAGLKEAVAALPLEQAVLDGEVVVLDEQGVSHFQLLQNAFNHPDANSQLVYYVFDLLHLDGRDLRPLPLEERKTILRKLIPEKKRPGQVRYSEHVVGRGGELHRTACRSQLEGLISKRRTSPYVSGRGRDWLKSKCGHEQELVIAGYTDPGGSRTGFGSLLLGYYDGKRGLTYAGRVGTGFSDRTLRDLTPKLKRLERSHSPFDHGTRTAQGSDVHWVRPTQVAQIKFAEWTKEGLLRQPSFLGLRLDKSATKVVRERPVKRPR
jgi:bifunctional non-homologous end joining protein LigD